MPRNMADIYWLAGLIEGEGCWLAKSYARKSGSGEIKCLRLLVGMTDLDVIQRAHRILGTPVPIITRMSRGRQPFHLLKVHGSLAIQWAMTLYSLMGKRRKLKIQELIGMWLTKTQDLDGRDYGRIADLRKKGLSQRAIGSELGFSQTVVWRALRQMSLNRGLA